MAEIEFEHVSKRYPPGVCALADVTLTVESGDTVVLVGPSGSGKTTALRLIAGLEPPSEGVIRLDGRVAASIEPADRNVALVFQRHSLYPHLTLRGNLGFAAKLRTSAWRRIRSRLSPGRGEPGTSGDRVLEVARLLQVEDLLDRYPGQLSGGQQQRGALGKALVRRPGILLLDEPFSSLDPPLRQELRRQLHLLRERLPATIIYVTHDQQEAMSFGRRVVILRQGAVQQVGSPQEVYDRPANRFVAGFFGSPPMGFLDGALRSDGGAFSFRTDGADLPVARVNRALAAYDRKTVVLGVRAEHVRPWTGRSDASKLSMRVALVERLGDEELVIFERASGRVTAKLPRQRAVAAGDAEDVEIDMDKASWFDPRSGANLEGNGPDG